MLQDPAPGFVAAWLRRLMPMRRVELLLAIACALALHGLALRLLAAQPAATAPPAVALQAAELRPVQLRAVELRQPPPSVPSPPTGLAEDAAPAARIEPAQPQRARAAAPLPRAAPVAQTQAEVPADPLPAQQSGPAAVVVSTQPSTPTLTSAAAAEPVPAAVLTTALQATTRPAAAPDAPPVYPTLAPAPFRLNYVLRRGVLSGTGELWMQSTPGGYVAELRAAVLGAEIMGMNSRGSFDAGGFAPERFVDRRRGRDRLAANFDRTAQRITYSGPPTVHPLRPGTQDRLSWMVQLSAIVQAQPQRFGPGQGIVMAVSGARGDLDLWNFSVVAREDLDLPAGRVAQALHLQREPLRPYDTRVEIWLDPAQHHLPVRAQLTVVPGGDTLELAWSRP